MNAQDAFNAALSAFIRETLRESHERSRRLARRCGRDAGELPVVCDVSNIGFIDYCGAREMWRYEQRQREREEPSYRRGRCPLPFP